MKVIEFKIRDEPNPVFINLDQIVCFEKAYNARFSFVTLPHRTLELEITCDALQQLIRETGGHLGKIGANPSCDVCFPDIVETVIDGDAYRCPKCGNRIGIPQEGNQ